MKSKQKSYQSSSTASTWEGEHGQFPATFRDAQGHGPLGPENILVFACSPITGTTVPGASRYTVAAKSPLTGGFGEAEAGGWWALSSNGPAMMPSSSKASLPQPVYLWIKDDKIELRDAASITGKTTGEAEAYDP